MGQSAQAKENLPESSLQNNEIASTIVHQDWAERILLVGLRRGGKTLFLQTLHPTAILDEDLFESVSGKLLEDILPYLHEKGDLPGLLNTIKSTSSNEKIILLETFIDLVVNNTNSEIQEISYTDLLLELWEYRQFVDFYYENLDRFNFPENLELFIEKVKQYQVDQILFDPFRIISKGSYGYTEFVKEHDGNSITLIENRGTRPDTNLNAQKVIVMTVSLSDCMISVLDESKGIKSNFFGSPNSQTQGKFDCALSFFEDIVNSRALRDFQMNTRLCILFTKADLFMKRLEKYEHFPRNGKDQCNIQRNDEILTLRNTLKERQIINYVVNEFEQVLISSGLENIELDYHIINTLIKEEVNQAFNLLIKPLKERLPVKHFLSPCLYRPLEYFPTQLWTHLLHNSLSDVILITHQVDHTINSKVMNH